MNKLLKAGLKSLPAVALGWASKGPIENFLRTHHIDPAALQDFDWGPIITWLHDFWGIPVAVLYALVAMISHWLTFNHHMAQPHAVKSQAAKTATWQSLAWPLTGPYYGIEALATYYGNVVERRAKAAAESTSSERKVPLAQPGELEKALIQKALLERERNPKSMAAART